VTVGRKNSLLTGKDLQLNHIGRSTICLDWLGVRGQERGVNKHHNPRPGIPAEREKQKLIEKIM